LPVTLGVLALPLKLMLLSLLFRVPLAPVNLNLLLGILMPLLPLLVSFPACTAAAEGGSQLGQPVLQGVDRRLISACCCLGQARLLLLLLYFTLLLCFLQPLLLLLLLLLPLVLSVVIAS
jgi:hypothetical protein